MNLTTPIVYTELQTGVMFDITTKSNVTIRTLSIVTPSTTSMKILVFTKLGTFQSTEKKRSLWKRIFSGPIVGAGEDELVQLLEERFEPVGIPGGETQAFYVTVRNVNNKGLRRLACSLRGENTEQSLATNNDIVISQGLGITFPFGAEGITLNAINWNGAVTYTLN